MFLFCLVFAMSLCGSVYMCFVVTYWERADLLALVCGVYCEFVTLQLQKKLTRLYIEPWSKITLLAPKCYFIKTQ